MENEEIGSNHHDGVISAGSRLFGSKSAHFRWDDFWRHAHVIVDGAGPNREPLYARIGFVLSDRVAELTVSASTTVIDAPFFYGVSPANVPVIYEPSEDGASNP